jgi:hypothetical protein
MKDPVRIRMKYRSKTKYEAALNLLDAAVSLNLLPGVSLVVSKVEPNTLVLLCRNR